MDNTVNKKPTLTAINMKRDQQSIQDKQIIALMDQRRILSEQTEQNMIDLLFVGYHPPETPQEPERLTERQWIERHAINGYGLHSNKYVTDIEVRLEKAEKSLATIKGIEAMRKTQKKQSKKK